MSKDQVLNLTNTLSFLDVKDRYALFVARYRFNESLSYAFSFKLFIELGMNHLDLSASKLRDLKIAPEIYHVDDDFLILPRDLYPRLVSNQEGPLTDFFHRWGYVFMGIPGLKCDEEYYVRRDDSREVGKILTILLKKECKSLKDFISHPGQGAVEFHSESKVYSRYSGGMTYLIENRDEGTLKVPANIPDLKRMVLVGKCGIECRNLSDTGERRAYLEGLAKELIESELTLSELLVRDFMSDVIVDLRGCDRKISNHYVDLRKNNLRLLEAMLGSLREDLTDYISQYYKHEKYEIKECRTGYDWDGYFYRTEHVVGYTTGKGRPIELAVDKVSSFTLPDDFFVRSLIKIEENVILPKLRRKTRAS
jgi:hypothetical protein